MIVEINLESNEANEYFKASTRRLQTEATEKKSKISNDSMLVIYRNSGLIVLKNAKITEFPGAFAGTVIHPGKSGWYVGSYYENWYTNQFEPYYGEVKLTQE